MILLFTIYRMTKYLLKILMTKLFFHYFVTQKKTQKNDISKISMKNL